MFSRNLMNAYDTYDWIIPSSNWSTKNALKSVSLANVYQSTLESKQFGLALIRNCPNSYLTNSHLSRQMRNYFWMSILHFWIILSFQKVGESIKDTVVQYFTRIFRFQNKWQIFCQKHILYTLFYFNYRVKTSCRTSLTVMFVTTDQTSKMALWVNLLPMLVLYSLICLYQDIDIANKYSWQLLLDVMTSTEWLKYIHIAK